LEADARTEEGRGEVEGGGGKEELGEGESLVRKRG
jgi:hypothetical protein